jgi:hypothetical protein
LHVNLNLRHCEEPRSGDEAIQGLVHAALDCFGASRLAMTIPVSYSLRPAATKVKQCQMFIP